MIQLWLQSNPRNVIAAKMKLARVVTNIVNEGKPRVLSIQREKLTVPKLELLVVLIEMLYI
jgi:hypothetical protein